jgi:hypothetical protein
VFEHGATEQLGADELDRHLALQAHVAGILDRCHAAFAERLEDVIATYRLTD